jgi:hypothetical protein
VAKSPVRPLQRNDQATELGRVVFRDVSWFVANVLLPWNFDPDGHRDDGSNSGRRALGALVLLIILVVVGLWIIDALRHTDALQDCVMQGRMNCMPSLR